MVMAGTTRVILALQIPICDVLVALSTVLYSQWLHTLLYRLIYSKWNHRLQN